MKQKSTFGIIESIVGSEEKLANWMKRFAPPFSKEELEIFREWYSLHGFSHLIKELIQERQLSEPFEDCTLIYLCIYYLHSQNNYQCSVHHVDLFIAKAFLTHIDFIPSEEYYLFCEKNPNALDYLHSFKKSDEYPIETTVLYCPICQSNKRK